MSQQAYSKARSHFDHSPFVTMLHEFSQDEYSGNYKLPKFKNYYVFAIDGSLIQLPNYPEILAEFGATGNSELPMARASVLYDVLHERVIHATLAPARTEERFGCERHIDYLIKEFPSLLEKIILVLDRGYPSESLLKKLLQSKMKFVVRCSSVFWKEINEAPLGNSLIDTRLDIALRIIKFPLPSGTIETLATNLFDIPTHCFPKLYSLRWGIEIFFDKLKNVLCLEEFSSKTANGIYQDFWANMVVFNLLAEILDVTNEEIRTDQKTKDNKYQYKARYTSLVVNIRDKLKYAVYHKDTDMFHNEMLQMIEDLARAKSPIRPDRSSTRTKKLTRKEIRYNLKSTMQ